MTFDLKNIREHITPHDRHKVFSLLNGTGFFLPREMAYGMDLFDEHLMKGENSSYRFILHEQDGELMGYGCYGPIRLSSHRYHLHWLAVERGIQKQGLGRMLEAAIVNKVRMLGGNKVYAELSNRDQHAPVRVFYEKCGYVLAASIPDYYADGDDKVLYVKDLVSG